MKRVHRRILVAAFLFTLFVYVKCIEPSWLEVTRLTIETNQKTSHPLKIAFLTDLHLRSIGFREEQILRRIQIEKPDIVLIGGDSIAEDAAYEEFDAFLSGLGSPMRVWLVDGNWEHWRPRPHHHTRQPQKPTSQNVFKLVNSSVQISDQVWLVGLDDHTAGSPNLEAALNGVPKDAFRIGLFHSPDYFDQSFQNLDLALSGHTHGGQVRLPFLPPLWLPPGSGQYTAGWYQKGQSKLYVSRGLGNSIFDIRFFCRPELVILTLL